MATPTMIPASLGHARPRSGATAVPTRAISIRIRRGQLKNTGTAGLSWSSHPQSHINGSTATLNAASEGKSSGRTRNGANRRTIHSSLSAIQDITDRERVEEQILRQKNVLNAINRVFRETITCETDAEVARTCLAVAEELTGSKFGFIGEINQSGRFDTIALSDPGWKSCKMPETDAIVMINNMEIRGIWGKVISDDQSLIVNNPEFHPNRVGIPEKPSPITKNIIKIIYLEYRRKAKLMEMIEITERIIII